MSNMWKWLLPAAAVAMMSVSCTREIEEPVADAGLSPDVTAVFAGTRTSLAEDGSVLWSAGDEISVFLKTADNRQYKLSGEGGTTSGTFKYAAGPTDGAAVDFNYGVYPYSEENALTEDGLVQVRIPDVQDYAEGGFAEKMNVAVAVSEDRNLQFKNVCGFIKIPVYGEGMKIKDIAIRGKEEEHLAGLITLKVSPDADPVPQSEVVEGDKEVYMEMPEPVEIGATEEEATALMLMAIPQKLSAGFYVFITAVDAEGNEIKVEQSSSELLEIQRSKVSEFPAIEIKGAEPEKTLKLERVWGWYSGDALWTANMTAVSITHPDGYGMARGLAMDDEYIYLPKSSGFAAVGAVSITDPTRQVKGNVTGIAGGSTFVTSFPRMIKNTDPSVNGGKDVLLVCNLTNTDSDANKLQVYAYTKGITEAPTMIAAFCWDSANNVNDWRRYGDRFFVTGTWQDGKLYFPSFDANKTVVLSIADGKRTAVTQIAAGTNSPAGIKDLTVYPGDTKLFLTNNSIANLVAPSGNKANGWDEYTLSGSSENGVGTYGYNFFTFEGKNYIAYARIIKETKAQLEVIEDKGDLLASLEAQEGLLKAPVHDATDLDKTHATGNLADCCVRVIDGVVYIATLTRDGGLVVDKLVAE